MSRLLMMYHQPGSKRPDFVTIRGLYDPRVTIELKAGKDKGVMVDYQLQCGVRSVEEHVALFGHEPDGDDLFSGIMEEERNSRLYYGVVCKPNGVKSEHIKSRFSTIRLRYNDMFFVPHDYAFHAFAISRHMRTREDIGEIEKRLLNMIEDDINDGTPMNYYDRKSTGHSHQNLYARDILAIHQGDMTLTTKDGQERVELMRRRFEKVDDLKRVTLDGPNGNSIYALCEDDVHDVFNNQMRKVVGERREIVEGVDAERQECVGMLDGIEKTVGMSLLGEESVVVDTSHLSREEIERLDRLTKWLARGEEEFGPHDLLPLQPEDDIPF